MKHKSYLIVTACLASLSLSILPASASPKSSPSPSAAPAASAKASASSTTSSSSSTTSHGRALPFHGTASAVDQSAKTFTIAGKKTSRVFKMTDQTTIAKDGSPATMSDLTDGAKVRGSYWKHEDGSLEAKSVKINTGTASSEKAATPKKSKKSGTDAAGMDASPSPSPAKK
ncbi:MAG: hypothetical protein ACR2ID_08685 [Chthoniobacterales bacterium]